MVQSEQEFLKQYDIRNYDVPLTTVDVAIFTLINSQLHVLMVERAEHPHKQRWSLPGGFIDLTQDTNLQQAALRKLKQKTGVKTSHLEQVETIGSAKRDPRGWSLTVLYMALIPFVEPLKDDLSVTDAKWWPFEKALKQRLAFDHKVLLGQARDRLRAKSGYTVLPVHVLTPPFTLTQLQQSFEELLGVAIEKKSFRRRIQSADVLVEVGEGLPEGGRGRKAMLYKPKPGVPQHAFVRAFGVDE